MTAVTVIFKYLWNCASLYYSLLCYCLRSGRAASRIRLGMHPD